MKKKLIIISIVLIFATAVYAAQVKWSAMAANVAVADDDVMLLIDTGTGASQKITVLNLFDTIDTFAELNTITADKTLVNEEDAVTWDSIITFSTAITLSDAATIDQSANNYIDFAENADTILFYYDATDLGIIWSDGALNLQNAEDGVNAIVNIIGKDAGEYGILRVLSDGDDKYIEIYNDDTDAVITNSAGNIILNPVGLGIVIGDNGDEDYTITFDGDTSNGILNYDEDNADFEFDQDVITTGVFYGPAFDAPGAEDMDYGSVDITDHSFTTDDSTFIIDGGITISTGDNITLGAVQWNSADEIDGTKIKDADYGDIDVSAGGAWTLDTDSVADNEIDYANVTFADFDFETAWRMWHSDAAGDVTEIILGANGTFLESNGAAANPAFRALAAGDIPDISATYQPLDATLTDIADGTIAENLVNTANPWADNEVADNITIDLATLATTVTLADDDATNDNQDIVFTTDAAGPVNLEADIGDFYYNPSTGTVTATEYIGGGAGLTALDGENITNDTIDNDSIDFADMTDLDTDGVVIWGNITAGELADDTVNDDDINWGNIGNLGAGGAVTLSATVTTADDDVANDNQEIVFTTTPVGAAALETDTDFHYNPSTGTVTATEFVGGGAGVTGLGATYATLALDNLAAVLINTSLISDTAATDDLGTEALYWRKLYNGTDISFEGGTDDGWQTTLSVTDPTADNAVVLRDAGGTVLLSGDALTGDVTVTFDADGSTVAAIGAAVVTEADLNATNDPGAGEDNYLLSYNHAGTNFTWVVAGAGAGDLLADASVPMTADWDIGNFDITLKSLTGDGTIEGATITEGGVGVPNLNEIDWVAAAEMADADHGDVAWSGGDASVEAATIADSVYASCYVGLFQAATGADQPFYTDAGITYDATSGTLTATEFVGGGSGLTLASTDLSDTANILLLDGGGTITANVIANANLSVGNAAATAGVLTLLEDDDDGANFASFMVPALGANTVYTLPPNDGDDTQVLQTNGAGTLTWVANAGGGAVAWDDISDPDAAATIDFVTHTQTIDIGVTDDGGPKSGLILDVTGLGAGVTDVIALEITTTADRDADFIPLAIYDDSGVADDLIFWIDYRGAIFLEEDAYILQTVNNYLRFGDNSDELLIYFGGTDVEIEWDDGALNLRNQENGIDGIVNVAGYNAGEKGIFRVLSDGDDKYIELHHDDTDGHIITDTGDIHIEPAGGDTVFTGNGDFGGADLELPQASPAVPAVDGGVEVDFTDGKMVIQHGAAHAELGGATDIVMGSLIQSWSGTIYEPDGINDVMTVKAINSIEFPHGVVITAIYLQISEDSNYTLTFQNFDDFDTINAGNGTIDAVAYTADTTGEVIDTTPTFATIAAGQIIMISIPATNVDWINFCIYYYEPAA